MPKKEKPYKRLPGRGFSLFFHKSIWQGRDHLLFVDSPMYTEEYKRFYFEDIQSIIIKETNTGTVSWRAGGIIAGVSLLPAILAGDGWSVFFWITAVLGMVTFIVNLILGPTCRFQIRTPVQPEMVLPVNRIRTAEKVINIIRPLIDQAQAQHARSGDELQEKYNETAVEPEML